MYKVFVNKTPIILTDKTDFPTKKRWEIVHFKTGNELAEIVAKMEQKIITETVVVFHFDIDELWVAFVNQFRYVQAAGGLVFNNEGDFLAIFRNKKWDLPKGHLKKGERPEYGGMREVEEECGINGLSIHKPLANTFHIYDRKGLVLKKTFWYTMKSDFSEELVPQIEEGITKVEWKSRTEVKEMMKNSYPIIQDLLKIGL